MKLSESVYAVVRLEIETGQLFVDDLMTRDYFGGNNYYNPESEEFETNPRTPLLLALLTRSYNKQEDKKHG
jgi:hypothetical protein